MRVLSGFSRLLTSFVAFGLLAFAQHGGGGAHSGGGGLGGAHTSGGGMHASGGGFHASPGSNGNGLHGPSTSHGYASGGAFPAGVTGSPYATSGGAFPAVVHGSPYAPFRSSPTVGVGAYPGVSHSGAHDRGHYGSRRGRPGYGAPFAYFAPYGYLGTLFYGDYDNGFVDSTPYDYGARDGYNAGGYNGDVQSPYPQPAYPQQPPYADQQQPYPEQPPYDPSVADPYQQYPIPLRIPGTQSAPTVSEPVPPSPPSPPISLVLNSGEARQVQNYAIVGSVFWDLSSHPPRKIPVSSINVGASTKATEAAGAEFPDITAAH